MRTKKKGGAGLRSSAISGMSGSASSSLFAGDEDARVPIDVECRNSAMAGAPPAAVDPAREPARPLPIFGPDLRSPSPATEPVLGGEGVVMGYCLWLVDGGPTRSDYEFT